MLASSRLTRDAISHFSEQVFTNSRYFWRLSKKRKLRCGSSVASPEATGGAGGFSKGSTPGGGGSEKMGRGARAPAEIRAQNRPEGPRVGGVVGAPLGQRVPQFSVFS